MSLVADLTAAQETAARQPGMRKRGICGIYPAGCWVEIELLNSSLLGLADLTRQSVRQLNLPGPTGSKNVVAYCRMQRSALSGRRIKGGRSMIRALVAGFAVLAVAAATGIRPALGQLGYDRPGGNYARAAVANGDPSVCAARCERDNRCRSWSFAYPPASGGPAMCRLKRAVMPRKKSSCCVSGVRGAGIVAPRLDELEYGIDRAGGDYRSFATAPEPHAKTCAEVCRAESRCRAWTYRRPGYGTRGARCSLKNVIKKPRRRPCCISGVVR